MQTNNRMRFCIFCAVLTAGIVAIGLPAMIRTWSGPEFKLLSSLSGIEATELALLEKQEELCRLLFLEGEYQEGLSLASETLAALEALLGENHPKLAGSANNVAEFHRVMGDYDAARRLNRRAIGLASHGASSELCLAVRTNTGTIYFSEGNESAARNSWESVLAEAESVLPQDHCVVVNLKERLQSVASTSL